MPNNRKGKLHPLIILCGGKSERMTASEGAPKGLPKGLNDISGEPWLVRQLHSFSDAGGYLVTIVLGYRYVEYFRALPWIEKALGTWVPEHSLSISAVINPKPERGPFSSLISGWESLSRLLATRRHKTGQVREGTGGFYSFAFMLPVDVPCPSPYPSGDVFHALMSSVKKDTLAAVPTVDSKGGHPVLLSSRLLDTFREITPSDENYRLDFQLRSLPAGQVKRVEVSDRRILFNLNTPHDFRRALEANE